MVLQTAGEAGNGVGDVVSQQLQSRECKLSHTLLPSFNFSPLQPGWEGLFFFPAFIVFPKLFLSVWLDVNSLAYRDLLVFKLLCRRGSVWASDPSRRLRSRANKPGLVIVLYGTSIDKLKHRKHDI